MFLPTILRLRKLPARYAPVILPFVLCGPMTMIVSAISTVRTVGPSPAFLPKWLAAWGVSWLIAFPLLLVMLPLVRRFVALFVDLPKPTH